MEQALTHHIDQQDQVDEYTFCLACSQIVYLHDRDSYETCQDGVTCQRCADAQRALAAADNEQDIADWFNERVAAGVDPLEAARDADASCMSLEDWQEHYQQA